MKAYFESQFIGGNNKIEIQSNHDVTSSLPGTLKTEKTTTTTNLFKALFYFVLFFFNYTSKM